MSKDNTLRAPSRRRFVQGLALGGLVTGLGLNARPLLASSAPVTTRVSELSGRDFELNIGHQLVNFTGKERLATTVNHSLPAPILRWREGDRVRLHVHNGLDTDSSIHWHGIILPSEMDGVPGLRVRCQPERHLLVPQSLRVPGTNRAVRRADHRTERAGAVQLRSRLCRHAVGLE